MEFMVFLTLFSVLLTARATAGRSPAVDIDGEQLQRGVRYHVKSVMRPGGGLRMASLTESSCPLVVEQARFPDLLGQPIAFFPENQEDDTVQVGSTQNIMFPEPTECPASTVWRYDVDAGHVATRGTTSTAIGPHYSRFALRNVGDSTRDYEIQVCPCSLGVDRPACLLPCVGSLGLARKGLSILLSTNSNRPYVVNFEKVKPQEDFIIRSTVNRPI